MGKGAELKTVYRIQCRYAPVVFFPSTAVDDAFWRRRETDGVRFETLDGKVCIPKFIRTTNNRGGEYDEDFDYLCKRHFGTSFASVRSLWIARLAEMDDYWHFVELKKE